MKDKLPNQTSRLGFSLIELMIAISAMAVIVLIISLVMTMAFRSWRENNAFARIRRDLSFACYTMARNVRECSYDSLAVENHSLTAQDPVANKTSVFQQTGDTLLFSSGTDSMVLIPKELQSFRAIKLDDGVQLTLVVANTDHAITVTNQLFVNTRN